MTSEETVEGKVPQSKCHGWEFSKENPQAESNLYWGFSWQFIGKALSALWAFHLSLLPAV